jgi:cytochrome c oxidase subunit 2
VTRLPWRKIGALLVVGGLLVVGCLPQPGTREGGAIESLYWQAMVAAALVGLIVYGLLTFAILRYRRGRRADDETPPQTAGSNRLEVAWTVGPLIIITILFALTLVALNVVNVRPAGGGEPAAVRLEVTAFRWGWRFSYPGEGVVVQDNLEPGPEIVLPAGRQIAVTLTGADVVHSFYVPQFLYKRDAIPGRANEFVMTIDQPGVYAGQCAEFCGLYHARMPFTIRAVSDTDYEAWLADQRAGAGPTAGAGASPTTGASQP